ncbi:MAG: hypothetical protein ACXABD_14645 [Candidatus Thorarchaeota archaeon]|jgi:hypothetical protein
MWDDLWINDEFYKKIDRLVLGGKYRIGKNKKLVLTLSGGAYDSPWIIVKYPDLRCYIYGEYFDTWNIIHSKCETHCWKVCVYPRTVKELFELHDAMVELDLPSKCGVDIRDYTPNKETNYAAYFYCKSRKEAAEVHEVVKRVLANGLKSDMASIVKSGCTEHEISETAKVDPDLEKRLDDIFEVSSEVTAYEQGDWLKNKIKIWWLKYARSIGDKTYKDVSPLPADGKQYKTYQKED